MTNSNLPPSNEILDVLNSIKSNLEELNKNEKKDQSQERKGFFTLPLLLNRFNQLVSNASNELKAWAATQKIAGATGTELGKFVSKNTAALDRMYGSMQKNSEALLQNFTEGLRQTTPAVVDLTNLMINTGQQTEAMRSALANLFIVTGGNKKAVESAAKSNLEISSKYLISNQKLIETLNSLTQVLDAASFTQYGAGPVAQNVQLLQGLFGPGAQRQVKTFIDFITNTENYTALTALGIGEKGFSTLFAGKASPGELIELIAQASNAARALIPKAGSLQGLAVSQNIAGAFGGKEQIASILQLGDMLESLPKDVSDLKATLMERLKNIETVEEQARRFYTTHVPQLLKYQEVIALTSLGTKAALTTYFTQTSIASIFGKNKTPAEPAVGLLSKFIPIAGTVITAGLGLYSLFSLFKNPEISDEESAHQKEVEKQLKTLVSQGEKPPENPNQFDINKYIADSLLKAIIQSNDAKREEARATARMTTLLESMNTGISKLSSRPLGNNGVGK